MQWKQHKGPIRGLSQRAYAEVAEPYPGLRYYVTYDGFTFEWWSQKGDEFVDYHSLESYYTKADAIAAAEAYHGNDTYTIGNVNRGVINQVLRDGYPVALGLDANPSGNYFNRNQSYEVLTELVRLANLGARYEKSLQRS